jgi:SAM-dependent methyltransferase
MGCGEGKEILLLAKKGLRTFSMDLSFNQLCRARDAINEYAPEAKVYFVQANAEEPPFSAESFRIIHGKAILHHLDLELMKEVINRLLKPGGKASFAEPLARHPLFWLGRRLTPQFRTEDEHPLKLSEMESFAKSFYRYEAKTFFLLTPIAYIFRVYSGGEKLFQKLYKLLAKVDAFLFSQWISLKKLAWYSIIHVQKF